MSTAEDARAVLRPLPRAYEVVVRDRIKFRVGQIVFVAFSRDETEMGFAYPKEEREALVASDPLKFQLPGESDMRFNWVSCTLARIDRDELEELLLDAWRMVVPKKVWNDFSATHDR
ncbi:MmcQ/YjbR family DNA-binding protein [Kibdelosporangium lantanae]|uniref:MmcQ/YjbR family DNA-binding protein n=1 Tax=Kibdelosporangium lantanae TaxID=1497396 RepID=A0ABW3M9P6_9PSEU